MAHVKERTESTDSRNCGSCTACCVHLPVSAGVVSEAAKPAGTVCPRLGCRGCNVYDRRPDTCREFECGWMTRPEWPESWRPRESGLLCLVETVEGIGPASLVYETVSLALQTTIATSMINQLLQQTRAVVVVDIAGSRRTLVSHDRPPEKSKTASPHFSLRPFTVDGHDGGPHHWPVANLRNTV